MAALILTVAVLFLAFANGANDNFKGVATLYGSYAASFRTALILATVATFAGSVAGLFLAADLIKMFAGNGIVPAAVAASPGFGAAIALGAATTVLIATRFGLPVSTTHALTGAIIGAGLITAAGDLNLGKLGGSFAFPLLVSPVLAVIMAVVLYGSLHWAAMRLGIKRDACVCVGTKLVPLREQAAADGTLRANDLVRSPAPAMMVGTTEDCIEKYGGNLVGVPVRRLTDSLHFLSAAAVSFARGLNDAPKLLGLLVLASFDLNLGIVLIATAMAIGGVLNARPVAETMSRKMARMNDGQALSANLVTAFLVIVASRLGVPVSTTQVSVGAISGVGIVNHSLDAKVMKAIIYSWLLTLPIACVASALILALVRAVL
jgi:PiT family inorganic phosphate transporter